VAVRIKEGFAGMLQLGHGSCRNDIAVASPARQVRAVEAPIHGEVEVAPKDDG
jgi:hypothetical protein